MAVNRYDPVEGFPIFEDTDAPDIKVDPTEAARFAAEVGNRIVGTTTYLNNYEYQREGLRGYDVTLKREVLHNGAGWVVVFQYDTGWQTLPLEPGWSAYAGETPRYCRTGGVLYLAGRCSATTAAGAVVSKLPVGMRPTPGYSMVDLAHSDAGAMTMLVGVDGNVVAAPASGQTRQGISLAGLRFPVS